MLSYLCLMIDEVIADSGPFFFFYFMYLVTCSSQYDTLNVDVSAYGRVWFFIGQFQNTFRSSMGDLSILDPYQTFDTYT
jgi:hypothetical protein